MAKPVTHTVDFLSAAEEDLHRYTNFHLLLLLLFCNCMAMASCIQLLDQLILKFAMLCSVKVFYYYISKLLN